MKSALEGITFIVIAFAIMIACAFFAKWVESDGKSEKHDEPIRSVTLTISNQSGVDVTLYLPTETVKGQTIVITNK